MKPRHHAIIVAAMLYGWAVTMLWVGNRPIAGVSAVVGLAFWFLWAWLYYGQNDDENE